MPVITNIEFKNHPAFDNFEIKFTPEHAKEKKNFFTMIIGENGTGKSELLKSIVNELRNREVNFKNSTHVNVSISDNDGSSEWPKKIIASTFSVNDKLPFVKSTLGEDSRYYYGGMRTTGNSIFIGNYMSELFSTFYLISLDKNKNTVFSDFLRRMDLPKKFEFKFSLTSEAKRQLRNVTPKDNHHVASAIEFINNDISELNKFYSIRKVNFTNENLKLLKEVATAKDLEFDKSFSVVTKVFYEDVTPDHTVSHSLKKLLDARIIGVTSFSDAGDSAFLNLSSGQFNLIKIFSSIICEVQNDTLLIIDEPEISLHPSWQIKYIDILIY